MSKPITEHEVTLCVAGLLGPRRQREVEQARETDPQVRELFERHDPSADEVPTARPPRADPGSPAGRRAAVLALEIVLGDELPLDIHDLLRKPTPELLKLQPGRLFQASGGMMVYRESAPLVLGARGVATNICEPPTPSVLPDYESKVLYVRQPLGELTDGVVDVVVVRFRADEAPVVKRIERRQLRKGVTEWWDDIPLAAVIGEYKPGDEFVYAVEVPPTPMEE